MLFDMTWTRITHKARAKRLMKLFYFSSLYKSYIINIKICISNQLGIG